jgi:hypothetical protein
MSQTQPNYDNPYTPNKPLTDAKLLYGTNVVLKKLLMDLHEPEPTARGYQVFGGSKMGKSSILQCLQKLEAGDPSSVVVLHDLADRKSGNFAGLVSKLEAQIDKKPQDRPVVNDRTYGKYAKELLTDLKAQGKRLYVLVDNDGNVDNPRDAASQSRLLTSLLKQGGSACIFTICLCKQHQPNGFEHLISSNLAQNLVWSQPEYLGLLKDKEARALIRQEASENVSVHGFRVKLRQALVDCFSEEDLRTLCFDMGLDYESLPAQGKAGKAWEIVVYFERINSVSRLVEQCRRLRPNRPWDEMTERPHENCPASSPFFPWEERFILRHAGLHPFLLQLLCYHLHAEYAVENVALRPLGLRGLISYMMRFRVVDRCRVRALKKTKESADFLHHIWRRHLGQDLLHILHEVVHRSGDLSKASNQLEQLEREGLVFDTGNGKIAVVGKLVEDFVKREEGQPEPLPGFPTVVKWMLVGFGVIVLVLLPVVHNIIANLLAPCLTPQGCPELHSIWRYIEVYLGGWAIAIMMILVIVMAIVVGRQRQRHKSP